MSTATLPVKASTPQTDRVTRSGVGLIAFDAVLLTLFLGLTFLLGVFPAKDMDIWWHLRAGDQIRQTGLIPRVDTYTFGAEGHPWIDLHWLFQVGSSWVHERVGMRGLTLVKCAITTLAVLLLVTARRRDWPLWAVLTAWLPALLVLGGRMYIRPETLTLLDIAVFLAILTRIDRRPWLAFLLPVVQVAWVNSQGLFVFGPILLTFALIDAALRPGAFAPGRGRWWRTVLTASVLTGLACLVNPYGIYGAFYPVELAGTMRNPVFSETIAELMPVSRFIQEEGLTKLPFQLHLLTIVVGALSFLLPMFWVVSRRKRVEGPTPEKPASKREKKGTAAKPKKKAKAPAEAVVADTWRLSPFRLLLFGAFTLLSWQATRNSHQFAAVVGALTAWNFGEWAGAMAARRKSGWGVGPRVAALAAVLGVFAWVGTGQYYAAAGEGRTIGLGEEPLWMPHEAVKFAGGPGMPDKLVGFHVGNAALYEYYHAPHKKAYVDPRLEVMGPELYARYMDLQRRISDDQPGWSRELDNLGRPAVLADHEFDFTVTSTLIASPDWKCVYFDPIAAVFVHATSGEVVARSEVDFQGRHFHPDPSSDPVGSPALRAETKGLVNIATQLTMTSPSRAKPLLMLGMDYARRLRETNPNAPDGWKHSGVLELLREPKTMPFPRYRSPFNPVFDLSVLRATYALRRAAELGPDDFKTLLFLGTAYGFREMAEAELPWLDRLLAMTPINPKQRRELARAEGTRREILEKLGPTPATTWANLNELSRLVNDLLAHGRVETAADCLERAAPVDVRTWDEADRIATLRLHLGDAEKAIATWQGAPAPPRPGLRASRVGFGRLVEGSFPAARESFREATTLDPELFEAWYGLAVLEQDDGRARDALAAARKAVRLAPNDLARTAAQEVLSVVTPYSGATAEETPPLR